MTRSFFVNRYRNSFLTLLYILVLSLPLTVSAQQTGTILFHGIILDADSRQPLSGAHFLIAERSAGAADSRGMVSFYARRSDTVRFSCIGYKDYLMIIGDTLNAKEYVAGIYLTTDTLLIPAVVVMPRLGNIRAEIMSARPPANDEMINAANNLRLSAYQGLTTASTLGDPYTNYEMLRQKQKMDAFEKGMVPSDKLVVFSPFTIIPIVYMLAKGPPDDPEPPAPYLSEKELKELRAITDSLVYKRK